MTTQPTEIQNEIARQVHVQKPAHLRPGVDVGMTPIVESGREGIVVHVLTDNTTALVLYDAGRDTYIVARNLNDGTKEVFENIYVDQLGELIFGTDATEFTGPFFEIWTIGDDGEPVKVAEG